MTTNRVLGLIFAMFGFLTLLSTAYLPKSTLGGKVGPSFFPTIWGGALLVLGTLLYLQDVVEKRKSSKRFSLEEFWLNYRYVVFSFLLTGIYIFSMKWLGFLVSTALFTPACIFMLEDNLTRRQALIAVLVTAAVAGGLYIFFTYVLQVVLPNAAW